MPRRLIVNADDFGFTRDVNDGIVACHREGILTAATLMATGRAFRHAVELAKSTPSLDVGCHLTLVQGPGLPPNLPALLVAIAFRRLNPRAEMARQVTMILKAGIRPTHLDTHKHTHLAPPVLDALLRVSEEFSIPWVRKPVDWERDSGAPRSQQTAAIAMRLALTRFDRKLARAGARRTDHFAGFQLTGRMTEANLIATVRLLPEGLTELMCHPGFLTPELGGSKTRLKQTREEERLALSSPQVREALAQNQIQLTCYREL